MKGQATTLFILLDLTWSCLVVKVICKKRLIHQFFLLIIAFMILSSFISGRADTLIDFEMLQDSTVSNEIIYELVSNGVIFPNGVEALNCVAHRLCTSANSGTKVVRLSL